MSNTHLLPRLRSRPHWGGHGHGSLKVDKSVEEFAGNSFSGTYQGNYSWRGVSSEALHYEMTLGGFMGQLLASGFCWLLFTAGSACWRSCPYCRSWKLEKPQEHLLNKHPGMRKPNPFPLAVSPQHPLLIKLSILKLRKEKFLKSPSPMKEGWVWTHEAYLITGTCHTFSSAWKAPLLWASSNVASSLKPFPTITS